MQFIHTSTVRQAYQYPSKITTAFMIIYFKQFQCGSIIWFGWPYAKVGLCAFKLLLCQGGLVRIWAILRFRHRVTPVTVLFHPSKWNWNDPIRTLVIFPHRFWNKSKCAYTELPKGWCNTIPHHPMVKLLDNCCFLW